MTKITRQVIINSPTRLNGKIASELIKLAQTYPNDIVAAVGAREFSAKSLGKLLSLSPIQGQPMAFSAEEDAHEILDKMIELLIGSNVANPIALIHKSTEDNNRLMTEKPQHGLFFQPAEPEKPTQKINKQHDKSVMSNATTVSDSLLMTVDNTPDNAADSHHDRKDKQLDTEIETDSAVTESTVNSLHSLQKHSNRKSNKEILVQKLINKKSESISQIEDGSSCNTKDGRLIRIAENINHDDDLIEKIKKSSNTIGVFQTDYLFHQVRQVPDIDLHMETYRPVFQSLDNQVIIIRTLNIGSENALAYLPKSQESNPALGIRGIRHSLRHVELFRTQIKALLKVVDSSQPVHLVFPMISTIEEWQWAKKIVDEIRAEMPKDGLKLGIMIETPSSALMSHYFAMEVDFFFIDTDTLSQYTLAMDLNHPVLSKQLSGLHPSVLGLIDLVIHNAHKNGKSVGLCGDSASDEVAIPIWVGLGIDELSIKSSQIAKVKEQIKTLNHRQCQKVARQSLSMQNTRTVKGLVQEKIMNTDG